MPARRLFTRYWVAPAVARTPEAPVADLSPQWAWSKWLTGVASETDHELLAELRSTMFRRTPSLVLSIFITIIITTTAMLHSMALPFVAWFCPDTLIAIMRLTILFTILRRVAPDREIAWPALPLVDTYIVAGTFWCFTLGLGCALCISTGESGLAVLGSFLAMGTVGALSGRNPGVPRLTALQMSLIIIPIAFGSFFVDAPLFEVLFLLAVLYLAGMISINRQLHRDYIELMRGRLEQRRLALQCSLTKLPNRALFEARAIEAIATIKVTASPVFVFYLDLDGFKTVNDTLGHHMGDLLLIRVGERLRALAGPGDTVARLGGDEFALVMSATDQQGAAAMAKSIVANLRRPYRLKGNVEAHVGVSVGIATCRSPTSDFELLLNEADLALYAAKRSGKNTFRFHGVGMVPPAVDLATPKSREPARRYA